MTDLAFKKAIGLALRLRRKELHLKLREVSHKSNVSVSFLSQIEKNGRSLSIAALYRLVVALELTLSGFFVGIESVNTKKERL